MRSAVELRLAALDLQNRGRLVQARRVLDQALTRATDNDTLALVEMTLSYVESELETAGHGFQRCARALALPGISPATQGRLWSQVGLLYMRSGDARSALETFEQAVGLIDPTDLVSLANLHLNRGNVYVQQFQLQSAEEDFREAARQFEAAELPGDAAMARHNMGYAQLLRGQISTALVAIEQAADPLRELGSMALATGEQDRAEALIAAGRPEDAAAALEVASREYARQRARQSQGEALLQLARVRLWQDPAQARRVARRAGRVFERRGSEHWASRAQAVELAAEIATGSRRPSLMQECAQTEALLREQGYVREAALMRLQATRVAVRRGDLRLARERWSPRMVRPELPLDHRLLAREVWAELLRAEGRRTQATRQIRRGLTELHEWQALFGSLDLRTSLVGHGRGLAQAGLSMALEDGRAEVIFEWTERGRSLASTVAPVRRPTDLQVAAQLDRLRGLRSEIDHAPPRSNTAEQRRDLGELQRAIRELAWDRPGSGEVFEPVSLAQVQEVLAERDAVLLAHTVHESQLAVLVATARRAQVVPLGSVEPVEALLSGVRADLDMAAGRLPAHLRAVVLGSLRHRLSQLSQALIDPVRSQLDLGGAVVLVPSGRLAGMPWSMLPPLTGRPVTQARSATLWVAGSRAQPFAAGARSALLVAGPRVARAEEEVTQASRAWGAAASTLTGPAATAGAVSARAGSVEVLHIAAHGRHAAENPLFSGVELADGTWFGYDIDQLAAIPRTVMLSACEVGRSTVRWGQETVGMTAAWLHAGAKCVLAAPAAVNDNVACEVLTGTHERLAAGMQPAVALAQAGSGLGPDLVNPFQCFGVGW